MPLSNPKLAEKPEVFMGGATAKPAAEFAGTELPAGEFSGQRKLIRPNLAMRGAAGRPTALFGHGGANGSTLTARSVTGVGSLEESSHAEVFYFQKQIQAQTRMVVVLTNGDELEGVIEWYDRYAIKLRGIANAGGHGHEADNGRTRMLIYKDSIRYIYKAEENAPQIMM